MAVIKTTTPYGFVFTCTGGTAIAVALTAQVLKTQSVNIKSMVCGGAATTDIIRVYDASLNIIWQDSALVGSSKTLTFHTPTRVAGLAVGISGATTGWLTVFTE